MSAKSALYYLRTLQPVQKSSLKLIVFASSLLYNAELKFAINELEFVAVVWGLKHFRLYLNGEEIFPKTYHQASQLH